MTERVEREIDNGGGTRERRDRLSACDCTTAITLNVRYSQIGNGDIDAKSSPTSGGPHPALSLLSDRRTFST
jgi:hypothetical protein